MNTTAEINIGDIVYDTKYKEVFAFSRGDRDVKDRLRHATEEEKRKLAESGKDSITIE